MTRPDARAEREAVITVLSREQAFPTNLERTADALLDTLRSRHPSEEEVAQAITDNVRPDRTVEDAARAVLALPGFTPAREDDGAAVRDHRTTRSDRPDVREAGGDGAEEPHHEFIDRVRRAWSDHRPLTEEDFALLIVRASRWQNLVDCLRCARDGQTAAEARARDLEHTLRWYTDPANYAQTGWQGDPNAPAVMADRGARAVAALTLPDREDR